MRYRIKYFKQNGLVFAPVNLWSVTLLRYEGPDDVSEIIIPDHVLYRAILSIGPGAFAGLTRLERIIIPFGIQSIGDRAFFNCPLKMITTGLFSTSCFASFMLPVSVEQLGKEAFRGTKLKKVDLLNKHVTIGTCCFAGSDLEELVFHDIRLGENALPFEPVKCDAYGGQHILKKTRCDQIL